MAQSRPKLWQHTLEKLHGRHDPARVYRDAVRMVACALSMGTREAQYLECSRRYKKEELEVFPRAMAELTRAMEREPYTDLLGDPFLELEGRSVKKGRGEFYTPQNICDMMAEMTVEGSLEDGKIFTSSDPACGSGRMVLGLVKALEKRGISPLCAQATVQDLNSVAVDMAYINLTLWGVPTKAIWGDTIRLEEREVYFNPFWNMAQPYQAGEAKLRRAVQQLERLLGGIPIEAQTQTQAQTQSVALPVQPGLFG